MPISFGLAIKVDPFSSSAACICAVIVKHIIEKIGQEDQKTDEQTDRQTDRQTNEGNFKGKSSINLSLTFAGNCFARSTFPFRPQSGCERITSHNKISNEKIWRRFNRK